MIEFGKGNRKTPRKDKWEYYDVVPLFPLLGANHRLLLLHMSNTYVYMSTTEKFINQFAIGYMIKPALNVNKVFRDQVENA